MNMGVCFSLHCFSLFAPFLSSKQIILMPFSHPSCSFTPFACPNVQPNLPTQACPIFNVHL